jgi:hypothetical protein
VSPACPRDERVVRRAHEGEREPQDPLSGATAVVSDRTPMDAEPVRHLAHRMLEALS